jgi:hypothetical protein
MTVDRRYYHVNEPGGEQYFEINLQPGYQRLCGKQALEFVANRHEDTSLTRDARDQRFLLSVKSQYGGTALEHREKLERIFGKAVETDTALHSTGQVLQLLELLAESAGKPVRQVPFHVNLLPTYDTASQAEINEAVSSFLQGTAAIHEHSPLQQHTGTGGSHHSSHHSGPVEVPGAAPTPASTIEEARSIAPYLAFPVEVPRYQATSAEAVPDLVRRYDIHGGGRSLYPAYVVVIDHGGLGEFYDVMGTSWRNPPILSNPTMEIREGSRTYALYYDGEHIRTVAWHEGAAVYWIENTLTNGITPRTMVALAQATQPVTGTTLTPPPGGLTAPVGSLVPPSRTTASTGLSDLSAGIAVIALLLLCGVSVLVIRRQRELSGLRDGVAHALTLEATRRSALARDPRPVAATAPAVPAVSPTPATPAVPVAAGAAASAEPAGPGPATEAARANPTPVAQPAPAPEEPAPAMSGPAPATAAGQQLQAAQPAPAPAPAAPATPAEPAQGKPPGGPPASAGP